MPMDWQQTIAVANSGPVQTIEVANRNHTMSWNNAKVGFATCTVRTHESARWMSLCLVECPADGRKTQTMLTIEEAGTRALYARLHAMYRATDAIAPHGISPNAVAPPQLSTGEPAMTHQLRAAFELWAHRNGFDISRCQGAYIEASTEGAWVAWQYLSVHVPPATQDGTQDSKGT